jgi:transposase-like protein
LDAWVRECLQGFIQQLLEEEVTEFLGRRKSSRRAAVDPQPGYRNGYGKPRRLTLGCGTITVRGPRMRGLLGDAAPVSASTVARPKARWHPEREMWATRLLDALEVVYLWVDGVYVKSGLERERSALPIAVAGLSDGRKVVIAVVPGARKSAESWAALLRDLRARGMTCPRLVIGDGHFGDWGGLGQIYPEAAEQRCWNHLLLNILDELPRAQHAAAKPLLTAIAYALIRAEAEQRRAGFETWCRRRGYN